MVRPRSMLSLSNRYFDFPLPLKEQILQMFYAVHNTLSTEKSLNGLLSVCAKLNTTMTNNLKRITLLDDDLSNHKNEIQNLP